MLIRTKDRPLLRRATQPLRSVEPAPRPRGRRWMINVAASLVSFVLVAGVLHAYLPPRGLGGSTFAAKFAHLERHRDDYDIVLLGSSRIFNGIIPAELDAKLAAAGYPYKSFNCGVGAMYPYEADVALRKILSLKSRRLKVVIIELDDGLEPVSRQNRFTSRVIAYHDLRMSLAALGDFTQGLPDTAAVVRQSWVTIAHLLVHFGNAGRAIEYADQVGRPTVTSQERLLRTRGYGGFDRPDPLPPAEARRYPALLAKLACGPRPTPPTWSRQQARFLEDQIAAVEAAGAQALYVVTPGIAVPPDFERLKQSCPRCRFWNYRDPRRFAELYRPEVRKDCDHLNDAGAALFTAQFASDLLAAWHSILAPASAAQ